MPIAAGLTNSGIHIPTISRKNTLTEETDLYLKLAGGVGDPEKSGQFSRLQCAGGIVCAEQIPKNRHTA